MTTPTRRHWWILTALVIACWALLLGANHLGLPQPEIQENRVLASMPPMPENLGELGAYREGMDAYVADRFPARARLIAATNYLRYRLGYSGTPRVLVGRDGWLFYDDGGHLRQLRHGDEMAAADASAWAATLRARAASLQAQGIRYLVLVPPVKEQVYPDKAPRWAQPTGGKSDLEHISAAVAAAGVQQHLLYLKDTLVRQRQLEPDTYTAWDTHWTGKGAHASYLALAERLSQLGAPMQALPRAKFQLWRRPQLQQPQDLAYMLGIAAFIPQKFPQFQNPEAEDRIRIEYLTAQKDWTGDRVIDTGNPGPVLQWIGDSFSNELLPYMYPHFSRIVAAHHQNGFYRQDLTDKYHPDIVVLEVLEGGARHSMAPAMALPANAPPPPLPPLAAGVIPAPPPAAVAMDSIPGTPSTGFRAVAPLPAQGAGAAVSPRCNLEEVEAKGGRVLASGWMADIDGARVADSIDLVLQAASGSFAVRGPINIERADVAAHFSRPVAHSGFQLDVSDDALPRGQYDLFLVQRYGGHEAICATGKSLRVNGAGQGSK